jgi:hypothetical protein
VFSNSFRIHVLAWRGAQAAAKRPLRWWQSLPDATLSTPCLPCRENFVRVAIPTSTQCRPSRMSKPVDAASVGAGDHLAQASRVERCRVANTIRPTSVDVWATLADPAAGAAGRQRRSVLLNAGQQRTYYEQQGHGTPPERVLAIPTIITGAVISCPCQPSGRAPQVNRLIWADDCLSQNLFTPSKEEQWPER